MDRALQRLTPLLLLGLALLVWFERALPGGDQLRESWGELFVLRLVSGILCIYVLLLLLERQRMERLFKQVLGDLSRFRDSLRAGGGSAAAGGAGSGGDGDGGSSQRPADAAAKKEAIAILITALEGPDAQVRTTAHENLVRLTGQDLGTDAAAWRSWLKDHNQGAN